MIRRQLIIIAIVMSLVLYVLGVLSGLYANKLTEERTASDLKLFHSETQEDIQRIREGTEEQITHLNSYIGFLEANMNNLQFQQAFLDTLDKDQFCKFTNISMSYLIDRLQFYREQLPFRLEQYERENELSQEYILLKQQYNVLSLHTWILTRKQYEECGANLVHGLYFYSTECANCVEQGEELDEVTRELHGKGTDVMIFTIDAKQDEPLLTFVQRYYGVQTTPALIINDKLFQGRVYTAEELLDEIS